MPKCSRISAAASITAPRIRYDDNSRFGNKVTWRVAPAWVIEETGTKLKASVGTGFKAPALQQLFGAFGGNAAAEAGNQHRL